MNPFPWHYAAALAFLIVLNGVFAMSELPRQRSTSIRLQLCPELPDQVKEMAFAESSNWGLSICAGASQVLYLVKCVRFRVRFLEQVKELTWVGMRVEVEFTVPAAQNGGDPPNADDQDRRDILSNYITVDLIEGIGARAANVRACAKVRNAPLLCSSPRFHPSSDRGV